MFVKSCKFFFIALVLNLIFFEIIQGFENNFLYLQANIGYANNPWKSSFGPFTYPNSTAQVNWRNGNGGFVYGFNIGYHAYKHLGVEAGYFSLPCAKLTTNNIEEYGFSKSRFYTNDIYLAARSLLPITNSLQAFTKIGINSKIITGSRKDFNNAWHYHEPIVFGPMFSAGLQYMINNNIGLNLQYLFFGGKVYKINAIQNSATKINPNAQLVTFGVIYNISLE